MGSKWVLTDRKRKLELVRLPACDYKFTDFLVVTGISSERFRSFTQN
jgi:hypothetical protein